MKKRKCLHGIVTAGGLKTSPSFFPLLLNKRVLFLQKMDRLVNNIVPGIVSLYVGSYVLDFAFGSCTFSTFFPRVKRVHILYFQRSDILKTQSSASET